MTNAIEPKQILFSNGQAGECYLVRASLWAGIICPIALGVAIVTLTLLQYTFMRRLGWHPISAPTTDWPSGLALGPYGWVMVLAFVASGICLIIFSGGILKTVPSIGCGPIFLGTAGFGMMLLGFKTDPTYRTTPATIHGMLHDTAFVIMGVSFLCTFVAFAHSLRRYRGWQGFAHYSWLSAFIVVPAITVKGYMFYAFLFNTLAWVTYFALRVQRLNKV